MAEGSSDSKTPIVVALIATSGTVLAAVIGLFSGALEAPGLTGQPGSSDLQHTVQALEDKVSRLEQRNRELENQLTEAPEPSTVANSSEPEAGVARETEAPIRLSNYSCIDLDSKAPDWDANDDFSGDLCFGSGLVEAENITVFDEEPDLADCTARTQIEDSVKSESLLDKFLCLDSSTGRTARVHVPDLDASAPTIDLEIVVWE
ncbi:hypothetical protein ACFQHV_07300 [Promicromonospora thailandica]|uniref:Uncharacterized protein n=1 Tax=Promicromonospora thailandica TaxID=765201 RepID=A0A9X2G7N0_9MICO|nr:bZIP transcription factor [Promicromonospora thailandica]MCP2267233.1 hypothetical protein [Promicromonospora thailandica]BFF17459.1 hypothetical protein GCM10025730_09800 [Promicromonospora thailandica]